MIPNYPWTLFVLEMLLVVKSVSNIDFQSIVKENVELYGYNFTHVLSLCPLRIMGGVPADIELIPYQSVYNPRISEIRRIGLCRDLRGSGSPEWQGLDVLHSVTEPDRTRKSLSKIKVVAGTTKTIASVIYMRSHETHSEIESYYEHPNFDIRTVHNDFGIVKLTKAFTLSQKVLPIRIHTEDLNLQLSTARWCIVSGFGSSENNEPSKILQMVCVPVISRKNCVKLFHPKYIHDSTVCAGSFMKDSCVGDSGGPLICAGVLVGLVSWGGKCGEKVGVYTRIASFATGEYMPFIAAAVDPCTYSPLHFWISLFLCLLSIYFCLR